MNEEMIIVKPEEGSSFPTNLAVLADILKRMTAIGFFRRNCEHVPKLIAIGETKTWKKLLE